MKRDELRFKAQNMQFDGDAAVGDDVTVAIELEGTDIRMNLLATIISIEEGAVTLELDNSAAGWKLIASAAERFLAKLGVHLN
jgi:hypothetical protein